VLGAPLAPVDVALLDVRLPDISGIAVCAHLHALETGIPVVACSGEAAPAEVARLLDLGVRRYFAKPMAAAELLATLDAILHESDSSAINQPALAQAEWLSGLTRAQAEGWLDWLEAHGYPPAHLSYQDGQGFAVRCPGFLVSRDERGDIRFVQKPNQSLRPGPAAGRPGVSPARR
jgi:YesN/AraC family two-component response regulator